VRPGDRNETTDADATRLTLEEAINRALEANRSLADASDRVEGSGYSLVAARAEFELKFFPDSRLSASGSDRESQQDLRTGVAVERKFGGGTVTRVRPSFSRIGDEFHTGLDSRLTQPLLRGRGREYNLSRVRGEEFSARSARRGLYLARVKTVLQTVSVAYAAVRQRELVRLNEESAERLRGHAAAAAAKERVGLTGPIDTYRARIQLKQAEDGLTISREAYQDALDSLKVLLALPLSEELNVRLPLAYETVSLGEEEGLRLAQENRVELDQARDALSEARRRSRIARHGTRPDLNLVLGYSRLGTSNVPGESFTAHEDFYTVNLATTTDLARTAERAAYQQSLLTIRSARRDLSLLRDEVAREAKRELRNLRRADERVSIQREQLKQAEGKLKLAQVKFKRGLASNFDVIEAEAEFRRTQVSLVSVAIEYIVGTYRLRGALGTLLERPRSF